MKIKLTIVTKNEINNGKRILEYGKKDFEVDVSLAAQMRYESKFPDLAAKEDLLSYTQRIQNNDALTAPVVISKLKVLYCFFDTELTFIQFLKLFDFTDVDYAKTVVQEIKSVFEVIWDSSSEKN